MDEIFLDINAAKPYSCSGIDGTYTGLGNSNLLLCRKWHWSIWQPHVLYHCFPHW